MPDEDNEEDDDIDESEDEAVVDEGASELANSNISVACMALIWQNLLNSWLCDDPISTNLDDFLLYVPNWQSANK